MKIVAGLSSIDDYARMVQAGADEVFCGYVPYEWNKRYGSLFPLNRREVLYYNVQIGSLSEMKILKKMVDIYKVPVTITINYLYYLPEQYELIEDIMKDLINIGFDEFIIADIALIIYLRKKNLNCNIQLSGECAEINRLSIDFFNRFNISRYIFHRKNTLKDMESCIKDNYERNLEYEAFILNEKCHFTGAFCSSFHCDELIHLCKLQYEVGKINRYSNLFPNVDKEFDDFYEEDSIDKEVEKLGSTGCGICALKKLKDIGVTHLKVVGRGNSIENMVRDIRGLRKAINIVNNIKDNEDVKEKMNKDLFNGKCTGNCYYI